MSWNKYCVVITNVEETDVVKAVHFTSAKTHKFTMTNFIELHKTEWKVKFENQKTAFSKILDNYEIDIQHVGSTAIPGLFAKPILDIDIIINNKTLINGISA